METTKVQLGNGNVIEYKIVGGTAYKSKTPDAVVRTLEDSRFNGTRLRIFYGDAVTGRDWLEEHDVIGRVGRSTGKYKIPILLYNSMSHGGCGILDDCIVKIQIGKTVVYKHPQYHIPGTFHITEASEDMKAKGYAIHVSVETEGGNKMPFANFHNEEQAKRFIAFFKGERLTK